MTLISVNLCTSLKYSYTQKGINMSWKDTRTRNIRRAVLFTKEEWAQAHMRYLAEKTGSETFSKWARTVLMNPVNLTVQVNTNTDELHEQIRGIATNINQITRLANTNKTITDATVHDLLDKLNNVQDLLDKLHEENIIVMENQASEFLKKEESNHGYC